MKSLIRMTCLTLLLTSCAANRYISHIGSINTFDSVTSDTLTGVKAAIDSARPNVQPGGSLANLKPAFNLLVDSYNTARSAYLDWRAVAKTNPAAPSTEVQAALTAATSALSQWFAQGGK